MWKLPRCVHPFFMTWVVMLSHMLIIMGAHVFCRVGTDCACAPCCCTALAHVINKVLLHQASEEGAAKDGEADGAEKPAKRAKTGDGEKEEKKDQEETADIDMKDVEKEVRQLLCMSVELHKKLPI